MDFNWARAIEKNRDGLIEIVTRLFVLAGIRTGATVATLPRTLRLRLLAMLRPAEFAARRLIVMAACKLVPDSGLPLTNKVSSSGLPPSNTKAAEDEELEGETSGARQRRADGEELKGGTDNHSPVPAFSLFDPFKRYGHPWLEPGAQQDTETWPCDLRLLSDDPVDASGLCRRIRALELALQDLEGQAARLARWRARRDREITRPRRFSPLRPGHPPGWRRRPKTALEEILAECNFLACDAWADTS